MNQSPFPPPPQQQPPQGAHGAQGAQGAQGFHNPYMQPAPPQPGFAPPPAYGQPLMHPAPSSFQPPPHPSGHQPSTRGNPVGAIVLGLAASVVVSLLYTGLIAATYRDQTVPVANTLYLAHALLNGAVVGALIGKTAGGTLGTRFAAPAIAALGTFFGYTNALPLIIAIEETPLAAWHFLQANPFFPTKAWWNDEASGGVDWFSPLGVVVAGVVAWGLAHVISGRRREG
ncbi:hypothetical protein M2163_006928 [Streptomyces sp. SAI-135]|nr:hypothetical protein [Streptomyces sp. SAI-090]MDH6548308.1 hypothetical protein [Streptomyces sp. SAI-041]MDH6587669.1 hypothetical protein [Streptomyces sp. SAI-133]MDH6619820.1 hypothetical protein [Streptomyces sp. SAI-135]